MGSFYDYNARSIPSLSIEDPFLGTSSSNLSISRSLNGGLSGVLKGLNIRIPVANIGIIPAIVIATQLVILILSACTLLDTVASLPFNSMSEWAIVFHTVYVCVVFMFWLIYVIGFPGMDRVIGYGDYDDSEIRKLNYTATDKKYMVTTVFSNFLLLTIWWTFVVNNLNGSFNIIYQSSPEDYGRQLIIVGLWLLINSALMMWGILANNLFMEGSTTSVYIRKKE